jgi:hypothetical protein
MKQQVNKRKVGCLSSAFGPYERTVDGRETDQQYVLDKSVGLLDKWIFSAA